MRRKIRRDRSYPHHRHYLPPRRRAFRYNGFWHGTNIYANVMVSLGRDAIIIRPLHRRAKSISAAIPNARSFDPVTCFAAKHPLPRPKRFPRRDFPSHKPSSEVPWASSYAWGFRFSKNFLNRAFRLLPNLILAIL